MEPWLNAIRCAPDAYIGDSNGERKFTSLLAFFSGYAFGRASVSIEDTPEAFVSEALASFIEERLGGGGEWEDAIRNVTGSEEEAFDLFFKFAEEFEEQKLESEPEAAL